MTDTATSHGLITGVRSWVESGVHSLASALVAQTLVEDSSRGIRSHEGDFPGLVATALTGLATGDSLQSSLELLVEEEDSAAAFRMS